MKKYLLIPITYITVLTTPTYCVFHCADILFSVNMHTPHRAHTRAACILTCAAHSINETFVCNECFTQLL